MTVYRVGIAREGSLFWQRPLIAGSSELVPGSNNGEDIMWSPDSVTDKIVITPQASHPTPQQCSIRPMMEKMITGSGGLFQRRHHC